MSTVSAADAWAVFERADCLYPEPAVAQALDRLADAITARLHDANPLVVCVLMGGAVVFGNLLTRLHFPLQVDYIHATRYKHGLQGADIEWIAGPYHSPRDRTVLIVDDILDHGITLAAIEARFRAGGAREVLKAVLARKQIARATDIAAEFVGLEVPDRYVFGCGMDYKGYLRNLPGIYALTEST